MAERRLESRLKKLESVLLPANSNDVSLWQAIVAVAREGQLLITLKKDGCTPDEAAHLVRDIADGAGGGGPPTRLEDLRGLVSDKFLSRCNCLYLYDIERLSIKYEPPHCPYGPDRQCSISRPVCQCQADQWDQYLGIERTTTMSDFVEKQIGGSNGRR